MEGEGFSTGGAGGAVSSGVGSLSGGAPGGAASNAIESGFESIGSGSLSVGSGVSAGDTGSPVSIFESPTIGGLDADVLGTEGLPGAAIAEPVSSVSDPQIARVESGILDAVREAGTPEAGLQFLSDVPIIDEGPVTPSGDVAPLGETSDEVAAVEPELLPLAPEQKPRQTRQEQVQSYISANPDVANAVGNIIALTPETLAAIMVTLKKMLEEEQGKTETQQKEEKMSKKMVALLALFLLIELMFKAAEKGAKEATR